MKERETKLLYDGISGIRDDFIKEARTAAFQKTAPAWRRWGTLAACLAVVIAAAAFILPDRAPLGKDTPPDGATLPAGIDTPIGPTADDSDKATLPAVIEPPVETAPEPAERPHVSLEGLVFNELDALLDGALWYPPDLYHQVSWGREEVTAYYGTDLMPPYVPEGLTASGYGGYIFIDNDGAVVRDTVFLDFHPVYPEPVSVLDIQAPEGYTITVSKLGIMDDVVYILPGDGEIAASQIAGIPVTLGHRTMTYGPYDPDTHAPAGTYDLYTAAFQQNGISYEIIANRVPREEFVKFVSSILTGCEVSVDS